MNEGKATPNTGRCPQSLTLQLAPALSEYLRREAGRQGIDSAQLACQLLMRGLHAERLDNVAEDLASQAGRAISNEGRLVARLEAGALLGALSDWRDEPASPGKPADTDEPADTGKPADAGKPPCESAASALREVLERARIGRVS